MSRSFSAGRMFNDAMVELASIVGGNPWLYVDGRPSDRKRQKSRERRRWKKIRRKQGRA